MTQNLLQFGFAFSPAAHIAAGSVALPQKATEEWH